MSIRFSGDKQAIRRTTGLPAAFNAFTIVCFAKLAAARPTNNAAILYAKDVGGFNAETVTVEAGADLRLFDSWRANASGTIATLTPGAATGAGWFGFAMVGTGAGAGGLKAAHKPVGSGAYTTSAITNTPGAAVFEDIQLGDLPFGTTNWFDGFVAHLKVYNRALSDVEIQAEFSQGAPVSNSGLLSYHSFGSPTLATALTPDSGTGTFTVPNANPATSTDNPVFVAPPTLTGEDVISDTALNGAGVFLGSTLAAINTAIRLGAAGSMSAAAANTVVTEARLGVGLTGSLTANVALTGQVRMAGGATGRLTVLANPSFPANILLAGTTGFSAATSAALLRQPYLAGAVTGAATAGLASLSKPLPLAADVIVTAVTVAAAFVSPGVAQGNADRHIRVKSQRYREITFTAR